MQWIAFYDENDESNMKMINKAWVQVKNCKEGTSCDDKEFRGDWGDDEGSSTDSIVKIWRFIEDLWMEDAASSLAYAATAALAVSMFHI